MLKFVLTEKVFPSKETFEEVREAVRQKQITVEEVKTVINEQTKQLYNSLVSHFFGSSQPNSENIYKREIINEYIQQHEPTKKHLFSVLIENGLIGVCGRGYTFDHARFEHDEKAYNAMLNILFNRQIVF